MQTKYILHGGFTPGEKQVNDNFFREILKSAPPNPSILLVYFAKEPDRVDKNYLEDIEQFSKNAGQLKITFVLASQKSFISQLKKADIIYFHGGHSVLLLSALKKFPDLKPIIQGKIVAGDSAGANIMAHYFYSFKIGVSPGLGWLPYKIITHFKEENRDKLKDLKPELETIYLPEYQFKSIIISSST